MKTLLIAISTIIIFTNASSQNTNMEKMNTTNNKVYVCPMHPDVKSDKPGNCPKCGMSLTESKQAQVKNEYYLAFNANPQLTEAGKQVTFSFTPKIKGNENKQVPLETMHEYKVHLIVVSNDLSFYQHLHPDTNSDGSYTINSTFRSGGKYVLFADYMPTGGEEKVERIEMNVTGKQPEAKSYTKENLVSKIDNYTVTLQSSTGKFETGKTNHFTATITMNGKEINANDLENIMGTKGHMVAISKDTKQFVHVHPEIENGKLDLHADFTTPGIYRAFFQFQTEGKVRTADFVLNVI